LALSRTGQTERAQLAWQRAIAANTTSEVQYNYAAFLREQGRYDEAREWAERLLTKKATLPRYLKRRERPWFRKATALLKSLPARARVPATT
jgi:Tfp pilus assembly protein PilF